METPSKLDQQNEERSNESQNVQRNAQQHNDGFSFNPNSGFFANLQVNYERFSKAEVCTELNNNGVKHISPDAARELMEGRRTSELVSAKARSSTGEHMADYRARMQLYKDDNGQVKSRMTTVKEKIDLSEYHGHKFSPEEVENLKNIGNAGSIIHADFNKNGVTTPVLVSLDPLTNRLFSVKTQDINLPQPFIGAELTEQQRNELLSGRAVHVDEMKGKKGIPFAGTVQYDANKRKFNVTFDQMNRQNKVMRDQVAGVKLTPEQYNALSNKEVIKLENMIDKKGQPFSAYVKYQDHKFVFGKTPDDKKFKEVLAPKQEHKEQVGFNNKAGSNDEPVKAGSTIKDQQKTEKIKQTPKQKI